LDNAIGTVVPDQSAALSAYENSAAMEANHVCMTESSGANDQTYKIVLAEFKRMTKLAERKDSTGESRQRLWTTHAGNNDRGALENYADLMFRGQSGGTIHHDKSVSRNDVIKLVDRSAR
jgi:hypothetical protein